MSPSEHWKLGYMSAEQAGYPAPLYVSEYPPAFRGFPFWTGQGTLCRHRVEAGSAGPDSGASNPPPVGADTSGKATHEFFMKLDY